VQVSVVRRIIQFGTSRFLQAHVDLFVHEARAAGDNAGPITVVQTSSCELISRNGQTLRDIVVDLGQEISLPDRFLAWLRRDVILVDRIVSEAMEPVGAVAEQRQPGLVPLCRHESIAMVANLELFERLKLNILNLGHTVLAQIWMDEGRNKEESVRGILQDETVAERRRRIYDDEVIPGFAAYGWEMEARAYVESTLERFANPFINHRLSDVAQNHRLKIARRIGSFLNWTQAGAAADSRKLLSAMARAA
jgi:tagaturonate reductase